MARARNTDNVKKAVSSRAGKKKEGDSSYLSAIGRYLLSSNEDKNLSKVAMAMAMKKASKGTPERKPARRGPKKSAIPEPGPSQKRGGKRSARPRKSSSEEAGPSPGRKRGQDPEMCDAKMSSQKKVSRRGRPKQSASPAANSSQAGGSSKRRKAPEMYEAESGCFRLGQKALEEAHESINSERRRKGSQGARGGRTRNRRGSRKSSRQSKGKGKGKGKGRSSGRKQSKCAGRRRSRNKKASSSRRR